MANKHHISQSKLEKFNIAFEYDVSWKDAKKSIRERTHKH